jgi:hypothetical protein
MNTPEKPKRNIADTTNHINRRPTIEIDLVSRWANKYISAAMKFLSQHILHLCVLLSYLFGSVLVELAHHDEHALVLQSNPVLESHDCGAKEIHVAWEDSRHCIACSHFSQRLSTEANAFSGINASVYHVAIVSTHTEQPLETDILYSGKRGPPFA